MTEPRTMMETAVEIAREAGKLLMADLPLGRARGSDIEHKEGRELVSETDRRSETLIAKRLTAAFADHSVVGEEEGLRGGNGGRIRWLVDPLDGTTNYLHGHPFFAVSLAAQSLESGDMQACCVHLPYLDETYCGARGVGAFLNSETIPLAVSQTRQLDDALTASGFAYDRQRWPNYDNFVRMAKRSRGIRRCGSAAIDLCFVAAGRYDAYWELGVRPWDVAAGALLVELAGGRVGDFGGGEDWLESGEIVAAGPHLFDAVREQIQGA